MSKNKRSHMRFDSVSLLTADLSKQLIFYRDVLGLPVIGQKDKSVTFQIGASRLKFVQDETDAFYHFAFNIPPQQFAEAKSWLSERVVLIRDLSGNDEFHSQNWNADIFYFWDANGNIVEFIARHTLDSNISQPFSAKNLECISELGIVTNNVPQTVKRIQDLTGATLYRAEINEQFVSVGDETSLFIVVKKDRIWFPETKAAIVAPFKITITNQQDTFLELDNHSLEAL